MRVTRITQSHRKVGVRPGMNLVVVDGRANGQGPGGVWVVSPATGERVLLDHSQYESNLSLQRRSPSREIGL